MQHNKTKNSASFILYWFNKTPKKIKSLIIVKYLFYKCHVNVTTGQDFEEGNICHSKL